MRQSYDDLSPELKDDVDATAPRCECGHSVFRHIQERHGRRGACTVGECDCSDYERAEDRE